MAARGEPIIGTLNEGSLHAALKERYARPGDELEVPLEGFVVDVRRGDLLIEIQTGSFGAMGAKLDRLLDRHRVLLVHPIALEMYLQRPDRPVRKSPKKGRIYDVFAELVSIPTLLDHPNFELELVSVSVTLVQKTAARRRRGRAAFRTVDRELREVLNVRRLADRTDLAGFLPDGLPPEFTTADIARRANVPRDTAQKIAFCLRSLAVLVETGRTRAGIVYARSPRKGD